MNRTSIAVLVTVAAGSAMLSAGTPVSDVARLGTKVGAAISALPLMGLIPGSR